MARLLGRPPRGRPPVAEYISLHSPARDARWGKFRIANRTPVLGADLEVFARIQRASSVPSGRAETSSLSIL
jgi:hypothetical protein